MCINAQLQVLQKQEVAIYISDGQIKFLFHLKCQLDDYNDYRLLYCHHLYCRFKKFPSTHQLYVHLSIHTTI